MNQAPKSLTTTDDEAIVLEVCRRLEHQPGDTEALVDEAVRRLTPLHSHEHQRAIRAQALARLTGLAELDAWVSDPGVDEVMVNAGHEIWIDRGGTLLQVGELGAGRADQLVERVLAPLGRRVDRSSPIVDARLADGSRVCVVLPPVSPDGLSLSIRRFKRAALPVSSFTDDAGHELLAGVVDARCNMLIAGATSSGKTSLIAALLTMVPSSERLVVIEDTTELPVEHRHVVRLEARPATLDGPTAIELPELVRTALRLRPDRIVVGEVRGNEVLGLVQAMNTGHDGSMSTCHANGAFDAMLRLESLVLQAAPTWPLAAIRHQLARSIDVVVHVERNESSRYIASISEVSAPDGFHATESTSAPLRVLGQRGRGGTFDIVGGLDRSRR